MVDWKAIIDIWIQKKSSEIIQNNEVVINGELYEANYLNDLEVAKKDSSENRLKRIKAATKQPSKVLSKSTIYLRNKDIVAETLFRANGICQLCKKEGPFISIKTNQPFLEIHHIIPLEEGGEDSLNNTVAICPNCHKEAHYGINKDKIRVKLKNSATLNYNNNISK